MKLFAPRHEQVMSVAGNGLTEYMGHCFTILTIISVTDPADAMDPCQCGELLSVPLSFIKVILLAYIDSAVWWQYVPPPDGYQRE